MATTSLPGIACGRCGKSVGVCQRCFDADRYYLRCDCRQHYCVPEFDDGRIVNNRRHPSRSGHTHVELDDCTAPRLHELAGGSDPLLSLHARIVLLRAEGKTVAEVAEATHVTPGRAYHCLYRFHELGVRGLYYGRREVPW